MHELRTPLSPPVPLDAGRSRPGAAAFAPFAATPTGRAPAIPPLVAGARRTLSPAHAPEVLLGRDERTVVLLSLRDGRSSLGPERLPARILRIAFGLSRPPPLAAERREALRRYAVLYRLESADLSPDEDERLCAAGFSEAEATAARALVDAYYQPEPDRSDRGRILAGLLVLATVLIILFNRWISAQMQDAVGGYFVTTLLVTSVLSIASVTGVRSHRR